MPVVVGVAVNLTIRLSDLSLSDDGIMEAVPVSASLFSKGARKLIGSPLAVAMSRRSVEPVRIDLSG
jgi:hypothetical protein